MAEFRFGKSELFRRRKAYTSTLGLMAIALGVGAIAGLLTAPKSGKQLRKDMRRKAEGARDAFEKVGEEVASRVDDLWERGEELAEVAKKKAEPVARVLRRGA
jgi:gas vesicle protein